MRLGVRECVLGDQVIAGDVEISDGMIDRIGVLPGGIAGTAVPGFVDLQVNGFAGVDFSLADPGGYVTAGAAMAASGVTAYQPTFICMPEGAYTPALEVAAAAQQSGDGPRLLGIHLEGPFLSSHRVGAHDPAHVRSPDPATFASFLRHGPVSYTTIAPELPGAMELISTAVGHGVTVAIGHSDAAAATAHAAFDAGARAVTHLFNAQRPWRHRDPGIAGAALVRDDVTVTLILDGHHLAAETVEIARRCAAGRIALITDAISAAGLADGTYPLGTRSVTVTDGLARLVDGTIAGSVLTMDRALRSFVELGASTLEAIAAVAEVPAKLIGRPELGRLDAGSAADVTVLDDRLEVKRTVVAGAEIFSA